MTWPSQSCDCGLNMVSQLLTFSPLYRPVPAALGSPLRHPISTSWPPTHGALKRLQRRPPSPIAITMIHKTMTLHSMPLATMITNNFCACGWFSMSYIRQKSFVFVEIRTTFFRVSTCFNGCVAAMDAWLGFGTRLRWFCDRGVWWKRTFCGKFGSWNDVDSLLLLLDWDVRCQQWFEWCWQRFCCDVPDSNDSLTSRRRLIYVNLCFHLYLPSH